MPTYRYQAVDLAGRTLKASLQAESERHARQLLREQGLFARQLQVQRAFVDRLKAMEGRDGILSISVIHGFMAGDVPGHLLGPLAVRPSHKNRGIGRELGPEGLAAYQQLQSVYL